MTLKHGHDIPLPLSFRQNHKHLTQSSVTKANRPLYELPKNHV